VYGQNHGVFGDQQTRLGWAKGQLGEKEEVGNTWLLTCPRLLIVGMPSPWEFSLHVKHLPQKDRGWMLGVREGHPQPHLGL
jgi:hypothetical protein